MNKTISLCMIVKNEEQFIRKCLTSVLDFVDEIIIVDTGSTDKTKEICEEFTTHIYDYKWNNHFSDARNFSLKYAKGDWILWLDADEELLVKEPNNIKDIILNSNVNQFILPITMFYGEQFPVNEDNFYSYYQPRLFRNNIGFTFHNRIHETLILTDAQEPLTQAYLSVQINHYGYLKEVIKLKQKSQRNLKLLQLENNSSKTNLWTDYHLASEYYNLQNYPLAFDYLNKAIHTFLMLNLKPPAIFYRLKYAILIDTNSIQGAWPGIDKAVLLYPDYVDLQFYKGYILYKLEKYEEALSTFQHCLTLNENHPRYLILKGTGSFMAEQYINKCKMKITKKILYIGWIGFNNLGDELMYEVFQEKLNLMEDNFELDVANYQEKYLKNVHVNDFDLIVLGGGSIFSGPNNTIEPYIIQFLIDAIQANKKIMIWGTGIDSLAQPQITIDDKQTTLQNISAEFKSQIQYVFKNCEYAGVRGPLTYKLLKSLGVADRLHISGDAGFLMETTLKNQKSKTIGVNWGTTYNAIYGYNELQVEEQLVTALNELIKQGYHIYFYILWEPDIQPSKRMYQKLKGSGVVTFDQTLYDYQQLMIILNQFSFTINFKLHASYLSLAAQTPFIALGYRLKVYDFVKSINMESFLIPTNSSIIHEQILQLTTEIEDNAESIIQIMQQKQDHYAEKLNKPFEKNLFL